MKKALAGYSLVESMVVVGIIGILTALSLSAIPALRAHQQLVSDTETIRALLLDAKQRTLNQVRPENCLPDPAPEIPSRALCSDVGIVIYSGGIIEFANTYLVGNSQYQYTTGDHIITRAKLESGVPPGTVLSLLFVGTPPSATFYKNGVEFIGGNDSALITLIADNGSERRIKVYSFGTIEVEDI